MELVLFFASWVSGQVPLLGHDEYATREAAHARLDHPLAALFLPHASSDPEIHRRLRELRTRNLKWLDPVYVERACFRHDLARWARLYVATGRSRIAGEYDCFADLFGDAKRAADLFAGAPLPEGECDSFLRHPLVATDYPRWRAYLEFHAGRAAPAPR